MTLTFDHAIILVHDLDKAVTDYQTLGFTVFYGGQHAGGKTHNALVVFADGTYLELLAPTSPALLDHLDTGDRSTFLFLFAQGEGFGGYALGSGDIQADVTAMREQDMNVSEPKSGMRARPDGQQLRWQSALIDGEMSPFLIQDDTARTLRVPNDIDKTTHMNGVTGVLEIVIAIGSLDDGIRRYSNIFGAQPQISDTEAIFALPGLRLRLTVSEGREQMFALKLHTSDTSRIETLDSRLAHGALIEMING
jgi:hypothetical protein